MTLQITKCITKYQRNSYECADKFNEALRSDLNTLAQMLVTKYDIRERGSEKLIETTQIHGFLQ